MQDKNLTKIAEIPQIAKIVKITDYCLKMKNYENTRIAKKEDNYIRFLQQLKLQTLDVENKEQIELKIQSLKEGKDEEYLDINEKDDGIFLGDD